MSEARREKLSVVDRNSTGGTLDLEAMPPDGKQSQSSPHTTPTAHRMNEHLVVPIIEEQLNVEKRRVERGMVRISKTVSERTEIVDMPLMEEQTEVERVAVNRIVETAPPVRYEGDVMIVPVLEEVIVTEKRLMLREELHVRKRLIETRKPQHVTLRREEVTVERVGGHEQPMD